MHGPAQEQGELVRIPHYLEQATKRVILRSPLSVICSCGRLYKDNTTISNSFATTSASTISKSVAMSIINMHVFQKENLQAYVPL